MVDLWVSPNLPISGLERQIWLSQTPPDDRHHRVHRPPGRCHPPGSGLRRKVEIDEFALDKVLAI